MPVIGEGTSHRIFAQKPMRYFSLEKILKSESHAILPTRNCHSWRQVELSFTFLCSMLDLKRKLNMWAIFQKRVLTEDSFAFCVRVLLFIDKALSKLRM